MFEGLRARLTRIGFSLFPAYRGTGARITHIEPDWSEIRVKVPLNWRTRNYVGVTYQRRGTRRDQGRTARGGVDRARLHDPAGRRRRNDPRDRPQDSLRHDRPVESSLTEGA